MVDSRRQSHGRAAIEAFEKRFVKDQSEGRVQSLSEYQLLFPGSDNSIADRYRELSSDESESTLVGLPQSDKPHPKIPPESPKQIGAYRIIDRIGQGGMGVVYLAEQKSPVRRQVAVKVMRPGLDTDQVIARFESERQALALMDHRNIARVLEAGSTDDGLPFFVMEYVAGVPITKYCDRHRLGIAPRIVLFQQVCDAIQHSHQKGIIHRDIKPSNVLVTAHGRNDPVVKVIDFGVAKATLHSLTDRTLYTGAGQLVGTVEYMSPEQMERGGIDLDTRTDVYSLGVLLYELLVGRLPFDSQTLRSVSLEELLRIMREDEPAKPSTKITEIGPEATDHAVRRMLTVPALCKHLRGDLDWIILKAVDKNRTRRYPTASDLAADLQRHLEHHPVIAGPPSSLYRLRKFVQRNRVGVSTGALAVIGLIVFSAILLVRFEHERDLRTLAEYAEEEATIAKEEARRAENLAVEQKDRADELAESLAPFTDAGKLQATIVLIDSLWPPLPNRISEYRSCIGLMKQLLDSLPSHRVRLGSTTEVLHRQHLRGLISSLETLDDQDRWTSALSNLRWRLDLALECKRISESPGFRKKWREVIAEMQGMEAYRGLRITREDDLLPIGVDPHSNLFEFAHRFSGEVPRRNGNNGDLEITDQSCIVLVLIPEGSFYRGAQKRSRGAKNFDPNSLDDERPVKELPLPAFFASKYEMTQFQWQRMTGSNPSAFHPGTVADFEITLRHPVESVSWGECNDTLSRFALRLPTEAQWEYIARAGTQTPWYPGATIGDLKGHVNVADRSAMDGSGPKPEEAWVEYDDGYAVHAPVGTFRPNPFGLHDIHGNVFEWCRDYFVMYHDDSLIQQTQRILRGGSYWEMPKRARSSARGYSVPTVKVSEVGVRPVRLLPE